MIRSFVLLDQISGGHAAYEHALSVFDDVEYCESSALEGTFGKSYGLINTGDALFMDAFQDDYYNENMLLVSTTSQSLNLFNMYVTKTPLSLKTGYNLSFSGSTFSISPLRGDQ